MSATAATLFDKVWDAHVVRGIGDGWDLLHIDRHLIHDLSGPANLRGLVERGLPVRNPELAFATPDHAVSSRPGRVGDETPPGARLLRQLREHAAAARATADQLLHGRWLVLRRGKKSLAAVEVTGA